MSRLAGLNSMLFVSLLLVQSANTYAYANNFIKAQPQSCITAADSCEVTLELYWQGDADTSYCLEINAPNQRFICDIPNRAHSYKLPIEASEDILIYLVKAQNKARVAQVKVKVKKHTLSQKRRKVAWSIF
ncbi:DUF3019 domain-containing protein [Pseudoalteromonas sp. SSDWG2]|uniref:DUF3019 domain-containing protein n=1 Tax=Pseudoalteromonas sp. SSDWG2 TaxID=3139391 RepID=UPI003BA866F1